jgi:hypothetical protein
LVKGDTATGRQPVVPDYEEEEEDEDWSIEDKMRPTQSPDRGPRRDLTPPRREGKEKELEAGNNPTEEEYYEQQRRKWAAAQPRGPPPPFDDEHSDPGAFI